MSVVAVVMMESVGMNDATLSPHVATITTVVVTLTVLYATATSH
jgi:hypothetical protein